MRKFILAVLILSLFTTQSYATGWVATEPAGTRSVSDIDSYVGANNTALDLMLAGYRQNAQVKYASAATLTVAAGEIMVSNSAGTIRLMLRNTSDTTVAWTNIDTGSEAVSTTYYVYACASAITDTTFTVKVSTSSSAPTGVTYYKRLGSFYNDSSGNITLINNDDDLGELGDWESKTNNVVYQATADGFVCAYNTGNEIIYGYTDGSSSPTTLRQRIGLGTSDIQPGITFPVKEGDYWKVVGASTVYWVGKQ